MSFQVFVTGGILGCTVCQKPERAFVVSLWGCFWGDKHWARRPRITFPLSACRTGQGIFHFLVCFFTSRLGWLVLKLLSVLKFSDFFFFFLKSCPQHLFWSLILQVQIGLCEERLFARSQDNPNVLYFSQGRKEETLVCCPKNPSVPWLRGEMVAFVQVDRPGLSSFALSFIFPRKKYQQRKFQTFSSHAALFSVFSKCQTSTVSANFLSVRLKFLHSVPNILSR